MIIECSERGTKLYGALFFIALWVLSGIHTLSAASFVIPTNIANYLVQLQATVQESPPQITIEWPRESSGGITSYDIYRKSATSTSWGTVLSTMASTTTSYVDTDVVVGQGYEYRVVKTSTTTTGKGYIYSGIKIPAVHSRGTIILIVDSAQSSALSTELTRLERDLMGDGWAIERHDVASTTAVTAVKALIVSDYQDDPDNVKGVFLFGRVPVPYSGFIAPDGHFPDHFGAWPADVYYGDVTGNWTDTDTSSGSMNSRNENLDGDGKFDQDHPASPPALFVGRVDLYNMPAFAPLTETSLLRQYLNKDHDYRIGSTTPDHWGLVSDNFGTLGFEAPAQNGWRNYAPLIGGSNTISTSTGYLNELASTTRTFLWAYAGGAGSQTSVGGAASTADFVSRTPKAVFNLAFGSWFGDWDYPDNVLRAPLASAGWGLTNVWGARPNTYFHHMGLGESIGYSMQKTMAYGTSTYHSSAADETVHLALMGDPSLRQDIVLPPSNVSGSALVNTVTLNWSASVDSDILGYYIYRGTSFDGPFSLASTTLFTGTSGTDRVPSGSYAYMVRAVKITTTPSGSFYNSSQGAYAGSLITVSAPNTGPIISTISATSSPINSTSTISFSIEDLETAASSLTVTATSSNTALVPLNNLSVSSTGSSRTITVRPLDHETGAATLYAVVSDGQYYATSSFVFTVTAVTDVTAPSIPVNLTLETLSANSISVSWGTSTDSGTATGDPAGLSGYRVYRNGTVIATTTSTSYTDNNLDVATTYLYAIDAYDANMNVSSQVSASKATDPPPVAGGRSGGSGGGGGSSTIYPLLISRPSTASLLSAVGSSTSETVLLSKKVSYGMTNDDVKLFQRQLIAGGFLDAGYDTGFYGPLTRAAWEKFNAVSVKPVIIPVIASISSALSSTSAETLSLLQGLHPGSIGEPVRILQVFLNGHGFTISTDGPGAPGKETAYFGAGTKRALIAFQEYYSGSILSPQGLTSGTGTVGPATLAKILVLILKK
jgi:fibronectin type 3 domain-containing protein